LNHPFALTEHFEMRGFAYAIAALAAVGIAIGIGVSGPKQDSVDPVDQPASVAVAKAEPGNLVLAVPGMHCQFSCFPRVKETLEATAEVEKVELAPQSSPDALDNRQVIVHYKAGFDVASALQKLNEEGFEDSAVVQ
jgi:periplasmic mercuric ion binding protein